MKLTEGTGSNAGTCLIKDWNDRKQSVVEIMAELEENLKSMVQILNFFNRQRYLVMLPEDLNFVY
jgi:hypothetical protein